MISVKKFSWDFSKIKAVATISGTVIGAGILALPVAMAGSGLMPGAFILIVFGVASLLTALYIIETIQRTKMKPRNNETKKAEHLPSLARRYLGTPGMFLMFAGILIYIYSALTGYLSVGGTLLYELSGGQLPNWAGILIYFLVASSIVLFGLRITKFSEFILFSCMLILIFGMISFSMPHAKIINLTYSNWSALPSIFGVTIFAYVGHTIIPSLIREEKDRSNMKPVVVAGFLLPLVIYLTWSMVICGVVPAVGDDKNPLETRTLKSAAQFGQPATVPLGHIVGGTIILLGSLFAVLATMTSYLGFGISLRDGWINFFAQFKLKLRKVLAVALSVLFPLVLALMRPNSFITALEFGGIYGGGLFAGILPCLLVLRARKMSPGKKYTTVGGNALTWIVMLLFLGGLIYKTALIMTF